MKYTVLPVISVRSNFVKRNAKNFLALPQIICFRKFLLKLKPYFIIYRQHGNVLDFDVSGANRPIAKRGSSFPNML